MIRRVYIHNFKSFVNFEIRLGDFQLFTGPNGGGKSAFFDLLGRLKTLICEGERISKVFPSDNRTYGIKDAADGMKVELELHDTEKNLFSYSLEVQYDDHGKQQRILEETLTFNQTPLFEAHLGNAQLYGDDGGKGPAFPMDWTQSGVGFIMPGKDNRRMSWFKDRLARVWVVRIVPDLIKADSHEETTYPRSDLANFADWYRHLAQAQPDIIYEITDVLRIRMPGFRALRLKDAGEGKMLYAGFENETGGAAVDIPFRLLSEGQKALICLYTILFALFSHENATLCMDEPENFLALPEIQPWLDRFYEICEDDNRQGLLISHHPRIINFLAADTGAWFSRDNGTGPTRVFPIVADGKGPISVDQLVERGWIDGGQG